MTNNLKKLRKDRGVSQQEVAAQIGVTDASYSTYERGEAQPKLEVLIKLADFYDVSIDYLLGYRKDNLPENNREALFVGKSNEQKEGAKYLFLLKDDDLFETIGFMKGLIAAHGTRSDTEELDF